MTIHLVTFSDESMSHSAELCVDSAKRSGVRLPVIYPKATLRMNGFYQQSGIPENSRGCGFWAWKPYVILDQMQPDYMQGRMLIYSDAGVEFIENVNHIIDRMDQDIFLFGNMYDHAHWCKRDIVDAVWPCNSESRCPSPHYETWDKFGKQAQASVIFFCVNDKTKAFVKEWLDWCLFENGRLIDDSPSRTPNHPEFKENRHDQAILTTMAYRDGYKLHWWPAQYNDGAFVYERGDYPDEGYPVLFHHHRRRNHEWQQVA